MSIIVSVDGVKVILRKKQKVRLPQPSWGTRGRSTRAVGSDHVWVFLLLRTGTLLAKTGLFLKATQNFHKKTLKFPSD